MRKRDRRTLGGMPDGGVQEPNSPAPTCKTRGMLEPADRYGENVVSWQTVWNDLFPQDPPEWHDDDAAAEMHRLRGLITAQAAETEDALGRILQSLETSANVERSAGALLHDVRKSLRKRGGSQYDQDLKIVDAAIEKRNRAVHQSVTIGSTSFDYATGGGEFVPVISLMGGDEYGEVELREDLALQHQATAAAVTVLRALTFDDVSKDNG
jgi:hypothetical protein